MKKGMKLVSWILFLVGIVGGAFLGLLEGAGVWSAVGTAATTINVILGLVGIGIGLVNINNRESIAFMVSTLVIGGGSASLAFIPQLNDVIQSIFTKIAIVAIPAAIVVALITFYNTSKSR